MANGECDNLLLATYLSSKCPVFFAPAMDLDMFKHPSTSSNISKLKKYGNKLIPSGFGELASGLIGEGRMAEPSDIIENITKELQRNLPLLEKKVLITAGPTYEPIDPVRFISNRSSGKMGVAIAKEAANKGASVDLVLGPSSEECLHPNIKVHNIETAKEMYSITNILFPKSHISIFAAAVSDYSPIKKNKQKIKKESQEILLKLTQNKDIISCMSKKKTKQQFIVGFALETENELENAKLKLKNKKLDMIIMNSLNKRNNMFGNKKNKITIIEKNDNITNFKSKNKEELAVDIIDKIIINL